MMKVKTTTATFSTSQAFRTLLAMNSVRLAAGMFVSTVMIWQSGEREITTDIQHYSKWRKCSLPGSTRKTV